MEENKTGIENGELTNRDIEEANPRDVEDVMDQVTGGRMVDDFEPEDGQSQIGFKRTTQLYAKDKRYNNPADGKQDNLEGQRINNKDGVIIWRTEDKGYKS